MTATALASFLLIALIKTPGEGGTVTLPFDTLSECQAMGAQIETQFEAVPMDPLSDGSTPPQPKVLHICVETK